MSTIILGRVRPVEKGDYDDSVAYVFMDRVKYNGTVYECVTDTVAGTAPQSNDFTYWVPLAQKGEKGDTGDPGPDGVDGEKGDTGDTGPTGYTGPVPQYKWTDGKTLAFENADGTYDSGVDLTGDTGDKGDTGPSYPVPLSNSVISTSTEDAASAYAANIAYLKALEIANRTTSDSITLDSSETYATSKAVYLLQQKIKSYSAPIGTIAYYTGSYWEAEDKSYACPYVEVNGVWTKLEDWVFCTGITKNGITVPDFSGLFILNASDTYPAGTLYDNPTTHTHSGSAGNFTLNNASLPAHTHSYLYYVRTNKQSGGGDSCSGSSGYVSPSSGATSGVGSGWAHSHSYTLGDAIVWGVTGAEVLPPYCQLSFIMKVA